jgi:hypothetical protein
MHDGATLQDARADVESRGDFASTTKPAAS